MWNNTKPIEKTCIVCGNKFTTMGGAAKYCSEKCRKVTVKPKHSDINEFCRQLADLNREREQQGMKPLTYGQYVAQLRRNLL